jgi:hypothetical protein
MQIIRKDEGRVLSVSDSPWLGSHAFFFRTHAIEVLEPLLSQHGELLPVHCEDAEVLLFNPTRVLDALDEGASNIRRFGDGRVMKVNEYVFHPEVVRDTHVFKIPNLRVSPTFISEHFVELEIRRPERPRVQRGLALSLENPREDLRQLITISRAGSDSLPRACTRWRYAPQQNQQCRALPSGLRPTRCARVQYPDINRLPEMLKKRP